MTFSRIIRIGLMGAVVGVVGFASLSYHIASSRPQESDYPDLLLCRVTPNDATYARIYNDRCAEALAKYRDDLKEWIEAR
ncbi:hypothetical protein vBRpoSV10_140 [Ruegeria phage vB_RpoS-V10]|nr:hypothetical protein vBRpoSV10_140 [Ruegeria phage vB_RpoS-V10]